MGMKISRKGVELIKKFEGCRLTAYKDAVGVWTIGYGTTNADMKITGVEITRGLTITQATADKWLEESVNSKYAKNVDKYDAVYYWTQDEFDALCSFAYNIGSIDGLVNSGIRKKSEIAAKILEYDKAGGRKLAGLTRRRKAEHELFTSNAGKGRAKDAAEIAKEVLEGRWGSGAERKKNLEAAGHDYKSVQDAVNAALRKKSAKEVAMEVLDGKWGNGAERKRRLINAGHDYDEVQAEVKAITEGR